MSYIQKSLSDGEKLVHAFVPHWLSWAPIAVFLLLFGLVCIGIALGTVLAPDPVPRWIPLLLCIVGLAFLAKALEAYVKYKSIELGVTSRRLIAKRGIISRVTEEMRTCKVETVELKQDIMGRLLGYGDVVATATGASDVAFRGVAAPLDVKKKIEAVLAGQIASS